MGIVVFVIVKQLLVLSFLTNYFGVPVGIAGMVTTGVLLFDMITDPLIGYLSDRTNTRWGRRAPWMFVGALVLAEGTGRSLWCSRGARSDEHDFLGERIFHSGDCRFYDGGNPLWSKCR